MHALPRLPLLLLALCSFACSAPDPLAKIAATPPTPVSEVLQTGLVRKALHATLGPVQSRGHCRLVLPKTTCRWPESALPYVYVAPGEPLAGREFAVDFVTRACRPFEDEPIALLLSFGRADAVDLTQFGHRDCWLVTRPDYILTADGGPVLFSPEPGRLSLRFTPPADWAGVYVSMQAVVQTGRGPAGWAVSPGLEVTFGTAR